MGTVCDYDFDHDLDTSSIQNMIADLEKRLGYTLKWDNSQPLREPRCGFYLVWGTDLTGKESYEVPYDEDKRQDIGRVLLNFYTDHNTSIQVHIYKNRYGIWGQPASLPLPYEFLIELSKIQGSKASVDFGGTPPPEFF